VPTHQGRPPKYCRRSHRQRAFEARCLAARVRLDSGDALVSAVALRRLRDRLYELEAALDEVEAMGAQADDIDYRRAFQHLYGAAAGLRNACVDPTARLEADRTGNGRDPAPVSQRP